MLEGWGEYQWPTTPPEKRYKPLFQTHTRTHLHTQTHTHIYIHLCVHMHTNTLTHTNSHTHTLTHANTHTYILKHTQTHTNLCFVSEFGWWKLRISDSTLVFVARNHLTKFPRNLEAKNTTYSSIAVGLLLLYPRSSSDNNSKERCYK